MLLSKVTSVKMAEETQHVHDIYTLQVQQVCVCVCLMHIHTQTCAQIHSEVNDWHSNDKTAKNKNKLSISFFFYSKATFKTLSCDVTQLKCCYTSFPVVEMEMSQKARNYSGITLDT